MSVPITRPRFVLAPEAVELPVPPWAIAISEAVHTPEVKVPTEVRLDPTTVDPRLVLESTSTASILNTLFVANSICSDDVQESVAFIQLKVMSSVPFKVSPPPSAVVSVGLETLPSSKFLSDTVIVVEDIVEVVP